MKSATLLLFCIALCFGCRGRNMRAYPRISNTALVVIAHDQHGALLDHHAIDNLDAVDSIVVRPPELSAEVFVTVFGNRLHETLHSDMSIGTQKTEGFLGEITVTVESGIVLRVEGNSITVPSPVTKTTLRTVESLLSHAEQKIDHEQLITVREAEQESGHVRK